MDPQAEAASESRYSRHALIDWWDQDRLAAAKVMVAGAGAIGNEVIKLLALLGVGRLVIVDFDTVAVSNLTRSVLFRESDVGNSKAQVAAARAQHINPDIVAQPIDGDLEFDVGLGVYRSMDVVIGCLDSLNARLALNRACYRVGVPWLNGGIETTIAEVSLFRSGEGPCFECAMSPEMWEQRNQRFACGGLQNDLPEPKMPTTATVASIAAGYLVNEALFLLHSEGGAAKSGLAFGQQLYLMLKPYRLHVADLPINAACLAHDRWEPIETLTRSPAALTVRDLLHSAGAPDGIVELGFDLLTEMRCLQCGQRETVLRPVEKCRVALSHCPACGTARRRPETVSWLDASSDLAQRPLAALGVPDHQILAIKGAQGRRYVQLTGEYEPLTPSQ